MAAVELFAAAGYGGGVSIEVRKEIPHGAGLGGGSSDAAAVLFGLDALLGAGLGRDRLMELGLRIGSDVPFFLSGGPAIGRGRGERLEVRDGLRGGRILIVKPPFSVSTAWAYDNVKIVLTKGCGVDRLNCLMEGLKDLPDIGSETFNSFESVVVGEVSGDRRCVGIVAERGRFAPLAEWKRSGVFRAVWFGEESDRGGETIPGEGLLYEDRATGGPHAGIHPVVAESRFRGATWKSPRYGFRCGMTTS